MNTHPWNAEKQQRLDALRAREDGGLLIAVEQTELDQLLAELDEAEWKQLRPALERMEHEHAAASAAVARLTQTRDDLGELVDRQRKLIARARDQPQELLAEHRALQADYRRLHVDGPDR